MSFRTDVIEALSERLQTLVHTPQPRVAWPNVDFEPTEYETYLRVSDLRSGTLTPFLEADSTKQHVGVYQVDVFSEAGAGELGALRLADAVVLLYPHALRLRKNNVEVKISREPSIASSVQSPGWLSVPISVAWSAMYRPQPQS